MDHHKTIAFEWLDDEGGATVDQLIEDLVQLMVSKVQDERNEGMYATVGAHGLTWRINK